jgi:peptidoglycan/LPS O-acetylase OafA/YrhL
LWRLGEFVVGIVAAFALRAGWRPRMRGVTAIAIAATASAALLGVGLLMGHLPNRPFVEVVGMLVVAGVICCVASDELAGRRRVLASRPMVALGAASYALYLCHALLFAWVVDRWSGSGSGVLQVVGWSSYVVGAVAVAWLLHRLVEVPAERWLRRRGRHIDRRTADVVSDAAEPERALARVG